MKPKHCPLCLRPLTLVRRAMDVLHRQPFPLGRKSTRVVQRLRGCRKCKVVVVLQRWPR